MLPPQKPQPWQPHSLQWSSFPDCAARREVGWVSGAGVGTRRRVSARRTHLAAPALARQVLAVAPDLGAAGSGLAAAEVAAAALRLLFGAVVLRGAAPTVAAIRGPTLCGGRDARIAAAAVLLGDQAVLDVPVAVARARLRQRAVRRRREQRAAQEHASAQQHVVSSARRAPPQSASRARRDHSGSSGDHGICARGGPPAAAAATHPLTPRNS